MASSQHQQQPRQKGGRNRWRRPTKRREADGDECVVCREPLHFYAFGECNHRETCSRCVLRSRILLRDRACVMCKKVLEKVIVTKKEQTLRPYESFNVWGDTAGPGSAYDAASDMLFIGCLDHYNKLMTLAALRCPVSGCRDEACAAEVLEGARGAAEQGSSEKENGAVANGEASQKKVGAPVFGTKAALCDHLKLAHRRYLCELCLEHRPLFVPEQQLFTAASLRAHETALDGHPLCRFCNKRMFDGAALYHHMNGTHISCHLCPAGDHRYYRDEAQLLQHLRSHHFVCDRSPCDGSVQCSYGAVSDFRRHLAAEHGIHDARITVNFDVKRRARDGTGISEDTQLAEGFVVPPPPPPPPDDLLDSDGEELEDSGGGQGGGGGGGGGSAGVSAAAAAAAVAAPQGAWAQGGAHRGPAMVASSAFPGLPQPAAAAVRADLSLVGRSRPTAAAAGGGAGPAAARRNGSSPPPVTSEEEARAARNVRLAEALGIQRALTTRQADSVLNQAAEELKRTEYPKDLLEWARERRSEVVGIEKKIAELLVDPRGTSVAMRPMPRERRRLVHMLAELYGCGTASYDPEPKRYVAIQKRKDAVIPYPLLSAAALERNVPVLGVRSTCPAMQDEAAAIAPSDPAACLVAYELEEGLTADSVLEQLRRFVPARTLLASSPYEHGTVLVATSGAGNARRTLEAMKKAEEAAAASVRITKSVYYHPFRLRPLLPPDQLEAAEAAAAAAAAAAASNAGAAENGDGGEMLEVSAGEGEEMQPEGVSAGRWAHSVLAGRLVKRADAQTAASGGGGPESKDKREQTRKERRYQREAERRRLADEGKREDKTLWAALGSSDSDSDEEEEENERSGDEAALHQNGEQQQQQQQQQPQGLDLVAEEPLLEGVAAAEPEEEWEGAALNVPSAPAAAAGSTDAWEEGSRFVAAPAAAPAITSSVKRGASKKSGGAAGKGWVCDRCTLVNSNARDACAACNARRQATAWTTA